MDSDMFKLLFPPMTYQEKRDICKYRMFRKKLEKKGYRRIQVVNIAVYSEKDDEIEDVVIAPDKRNIFVKTRKKL